MIESGMGAPMKTLTLNPAKTLQGTLEVPGDKSISHRAVMLGSLAFGVTHVSHFLASADCLSTIGIFRALGVRIRLKGDQVTLFGKGLNSLTPSKGILNAGNSGTTARILLGLLSGQPFTSRLTGDQYLKRRPMGRVVDPLTRMGAQITGANGSTRLPLKVSSQRLHGISYRLPVASAQVKSSLLMASLFADGKTTVTEPFRTRDHTERMFQAFSIRFRRKGNRVTVKGPIPPFQARSILVPGDISSAAFFIVAALLAPGSRVVLRNVGVNPTRTGLLDALRKMGARINVSPRKSPGEGEPAADLTVRSSRLNAVSLTDRALVPRMIDEFPVLAVAATQARGRTVVRHAEDLKFKESDRILMMAVSLKKMGADITATEDGWVIQGPTPLKGCRLSCGGDHRVAMSLAVAGLVAKGPTTILDVENIDTSFPGFEKSLKKLMR